MGFRINSRLSIGGLLLFGTITSLFAKIGARFDDAAAFHSCEYKIIALLTVSFYIEIIFNTRCDPMA
jgi:hypothetical protein